MDDLTEVTTLTEAEWSDVLATLPENPETAEGWEFSLVRRTVERIVAARLASVEALADEWDGLLHERGPDVPPPTVTRCVDALRAVLGSDAHTEQKGAGVVSIRRSKSPCGNGGEHNPDCFDPGCPFDGGVDPEDPR